MIRLAFALLAFPLVLAGCSVSDCCPYEVAEGITPTDADGRPTGPPDPDDWQFPEGFPSTYYVTPAYPNPAGAFTRFGFGLERPQRVAARLYTDDLELVETVFDGEFAAGNNVVVIERPAQAPGLFRLEVEGDGWETHGDVRFE